VPQTSAPVAAGPLKQPMAYVRNNICASGSDEDTSVASMGKRLGCVEGSGWDGDRTVSSVSELTKL
jgi:hypothetical protein